LKKKDNVESQVGPSSQKSIGKGPKNSSTIKKPESHKNSDEEKVESDDGSEFEGTNFEGSDFEESDYGVFILSKNPYDLFNKFEAKLRIRILLILSFFRLIQSY